MKHFKDGNNEVWAFDDHIDKAQIPEGLIPITEQEADALRSAPSAAPSLMEQIFALESQVTQRRMREAVLGTDGGWLANIEQQIAALREQL